MNLNPKNLGISGGVIWGLLIFIATLISLNFNYGNAFLEVVASIYPGFEVSLLGSFIGLVYGFIDGFAALFIFGWIYNWLERRNQNV